MFIKNTRSDKIGSQTATLTAVNSPKPTIKKAETLTQQYIEGGNETIGVLAIGRHPRKNYPGWLSSCEI
jgi:hypothetical protein